MLGRQEPARGAEEGHQAAEGAKQPQGESMLDTAKGFASSVVGKARACACCLLLLALAGVAVDQQGHHLTLGSLLSTYTEMRMCLHYVSVVNACCLLKTRP